MQSLYGDSTVLVRLTEHDGLSFMVLEALNAGRHVFWSHSFEHVWHAPDYQTLRDRLSELVPLHEAGMLVVNTDGVLHVNEQYSGEAVGQALARVLEGATGKV